jgi:flagellar export protein FliJ
MRRFRFRLERVLEAWRRGERLRQTELAATLAAKVEVGAQLADALSRRASLGQDLDLEPGEECSVLDLLAIDRERRALKKRTADLEREVEWLAGVAADQRAALVEIGRRVRLLERLRERARADYRRLRARFEAKAIDDHTVARRALTMVPGGNR